MDPGGRAGNELAAIHGNHASMSKAAAHRSTPDALAVLSDQIDEACGTLRAMANETRLKVLCVLSSGEMSVNQLAEMTGQSLSAVSQHLAKLRAEGLVATT